MDSNYLNIQYLFLLNGFLHQLLHEQWLLSSRHFIIPSSWVGIPNYPMDYHSRFLARQVSLPAKQTAYNSTHHPQDRQLTHPHFTAWNTLTVFLCLIFPLHCPPWICLPESFCCLPLPELQSRSDEVRLCSFHHTSA